MNAALWSSNARVSRRSKPGFTGSPVKVSTSRASSVNSTARGNSGETLARNGLRLS